MTGKRVVAAFDFDETVTYKDSLVPFLRFVKGWPKTLALLAKNLPIMSLFMIKQASRQEVKEKVLTTFFGEMPLNELREKGREFAEGSLKKLIRLDAIEKISWHRSQGHECILVTAAIDIYTNPWGCKNGFNHVIASELEVSPNGNVTGRLKGLNCWGEEKCRRLEQHLGSRSGYILYAYGDSRGDREMLQMADFPFYRCFTTS